MWTFDAPPLEYWKATYDFAPDQAWLDNIRLASVRLPNCSSSIVSSRGLVLTNHHCARSCIALASPRDTNYNEVGFVASSQADERNHTNKGDHIRSACAAETKKSCRAIDLPITQQRSGLVATARAAP